MAVKLTTTRQAARINGLKTLVYGPAGSGKTTLCKTMPGNPVIISAEGGLLSLRDTDIPVIEVGSYQDVLDAYAFLTTDPEGQKFDWVALDSISEIAEVVLSFEKKQTPDPRKAYGALQEQMTDMLRAFRDLPGRNVYMSCKMERQKDEQTGAMLYSPLLPGSKLAQQIPYLFDEVLCLRVDRDDAGNPVRYLQTTSDFNYTAKDRSGALDVMGEYPDLGEIARKVLGAPVTAQSSPVTQQSDSATEAATAAAAA